MSVPSRTAYVSCGVVLPQRRAPEGASHPWNHWPALWSAVRPAPVLAWNHLVSVYLHHAERTFPCCTCSTITEGNRRVAALLPATRPSHTVGGVGRAFDDDHHGLAGGGAGTPPAAGARGNGADLASNSGRAPAFPRVRSPRVGWRAGVGGVWLGGRNERSCRAGRPQRGVPVPPCRSRRCRRHGCCVAPGR